jgi:hypothetical protein
LLDLTLTEIKERAPLVLSQCTQRVETADEANVTPAKETSLVVVLHQGFDVIRLECESPGRVVLGGVLDEEKGVFVETKVARLVSKFGNLYWGIMLDQMPENDTVVRITSVDHG